LARHEPHRDLGLRLTASRRAISERLAKTDASNTDWQRDLAASHGRIGGVLLAQGDRAGALTNWRKTLTIAETLTATAEEAEGKTGGKLGPRTAEALGNVAWHALFVYEFKKGLAASERAQGLATELIWIDGNRAHALMFLQRAREARAVYLVHKGKSLWGKRWEEVIADNFDKLRKAGLAHPMMAEMERTLGVTPSPAAKQVAGRRTGR